MNIKSILVLLLSGLYLFACHYWYCCKVQGACYGCGTAGNAAVALAPVVSPEKGALLFQWSKETPIINEGFGEEKKTWLAGKKADNLLEITGEYFEEESVPEGFANMGLARADEIRKLIILELPDERIRLKGEMVPERATIKLNPFKSIKAKWVPIGMEASEVIDFGQKAVILFPSNSYLKETDEEIDQFLKTIAERIAETGEVIFLTGHTDNAGNINNNKRLGLKRAMRIRRILRQKGVSRDQIVAFSKGEQEPIADNSTEKGRYQNRRVVLEIKAAPK